MANSFTFLALQTHFVVLEVGPLEAFIYDLTLRETFSLTNFKSSPISMFYIDDAVHMG
jgi:hypothetical protein